MLENLSIKNFVIVNHLELNFKSGFSALTGETGAGKSILIGALSLTLGQRADTSVVRHNTDKSDISATFSIEDNINAQEWLKQNELESEEGNLFLRRVIYQDGKSKGFINGVPATINQLKSIGELLIDIYSQNSHHSLLKNSTQREILDNFSGLNNEVSKIKDLYENWRKLFVENENFKKNKESYVEEMNELEEKNKQFKKLDFSFSKWQDVQANHKMLSNGAELITGVQDCISKLNNDDASISTQINKLQIVLLNLSNLDDRLGNQLKIIDTISLEASELIRELTHYLDTLEINENLKKEVESKIQDTYNFCRKYRVKPEELDSLSDDWHNRYDLLVKLVDEKGTTEALNNARRNYDSAAEKLSQDRKNSALELNRIITDKLKDLSFTHGKFEVNLNSIEPSANGNEQVEFLISTYLNAEPKPIQKVASGGELSRISLAIRVASIKKVNVPVMIFDEVDVGIGGGVAEVVGKLLKDLAGDRQHQIFAITHLPQVAAQSLNHYKVSKEQVNNETVSQINLLNENGRVKELARMLGGIEITDTTLEHAKELLG
ncbi:DNA repair protein RecN [Methylophilaceae bacterium]|jgi:DNA repair protein RecN (Recombination protein N)|nr:DNA repair protein RecN [Methylophilaceae bacterium]|tara:strand:+ start:880 stop:2535 length:1656 start_codon:yes stop_codon:yes gene_type:complete